MSAPAEANQTTVLVVHPDDAARSALVDRLRNDPEVEVVEARGQASVDDLLMAMPDVLVVATGQQADDGVALVRATHRLAPVVTVVAIPVGDDTGSVALSAGAISCLLADEAEPEATVKAARRGESQLTQTQAVDLLADFDRALGLFGDSEHRPTLTPTEREVLERLAKGEASSDIADEYEVTDRLVNLHAGYAVGKVQWALDAEQRLAALSATPPARG